MKARTKRAMTPRMTKGRRLRLAGASAVAATMTAGAAAVSGAPAGCKRSLVGCAALSMSVSLAFLVKVDALTAHVGRRFEQERDRDDDQERDPRQDEHSFERQQHRLARDHAVEHA